MEQDNLCISWNSLPWKKFHRKSSSLQRKIYEAKQNENKKTIKRLQKLLLRSKSIYYIAVKSVTDYYSSKGIFLSKRIKSDLVNEVYMKLSKGKSSLIDIKLRVNFAELNYLKDEVVAYVMNFLIKSVYKQNNVTPRYLSYVLKDKRLVRVVFKRLLRISFLSTTSFQYLKSLLTVPLKYKFNIWRYFETSETRERARNIKESIIRQFSSNPNELSRTQLNILYFSDMEYKKFDAIIIFRLRYTEWINDRKPMVNE